MLAVALIAERFGSRPSDLLGVTNLADALDFDTVCAYRLTLLDLEKQERELAAVEGREYSQDEKTVKMGDVRAKITKDTLFW